MYPDDSTLLARGKYSTLTHERREQLKRVQAICSTLVTAAQGALRDCESMPPEDLTHMRDIERCVTHLKDARGRIVVLANDMLELKDAAWPS